jgi:F-type H+-transporting ATPase subunit epsilon
MDGLLTLYIVTPQGIVLAEDVELVTVPGVDGPVGVLARHCRLITRLLPGELVVTRHGAERRFAVGEGVVEVTGNRMVVATDMAIPEEQIDEAAADEARARAAARLREAIPDEEIAAVNAALTRALAQLRVARRRR